MLFGKKLWFTHNLYKIVYGQLIWDMGDFGEEMDLGGEGAGDQPDREGGEGAPGATGGGRGGFLDL